MQPRHPARHRRDRDQVRCRHVPALPPPLPAAPGRPEPAHARGAGPQPRPAGRSCGFARPPEPHYAENKQISWPYRKNHRISRSISTCTDGSKSGAGGTSPSGPNRSPAPRLTSLLATTSSRPFIRTNQLLPDLHGDTMDRASTRTDSASPRSGPTSSCRLHHHRSRRAVHAVRRGRPADFQTTTRIEG